MNSYDLVIVGGGDTGTAALYTAACYSTIKRIALFEREVNIAEGASSPLQNSHTLHFGDIESNFDRGMAERVRDAAELVAAFLDRYGDVAMCRKGQKMLLAVGADEVRMLEARYATIRDLFPGLRLIGREEIAGLEPMVMRGRDPHEAVAAIVSHDGYSVHFANLATAFVRAARESRAHVDVFRGSPVTALARTANGFQITTQRAVIRARSVIVATGPHSLRFAKQMGLAAHLTIIPIRGRFFRSRIPRLLNGKVYTWQKESRPFAAVHGDPDVRDACEVRFGPTTLAVPVLERHRPRTVLDFLRIVVWSVRGILSYLAVLCRPDLFAFIVTMATIELVPILGKRVFLRAVRKIVPSLRMRDIERANDAGGIRPQLIDTRTMTLQHGEGCVVGHGDIYEITPSPGASVCLATAQADIAQVCVWLGETFDRDRFLADHTRERSAAEAYPVYPCA